MKRLFLISTVLLLSLYARDIYKLSIWADYSINKEAITAQFCVNKDKQELKCNGRCHLTKQLNLVEGVKESPEKPSPPQFNDEKLELFASKLYLKSIHQLR